MKGIKHKDVGGECSYSEFHADNAHELEGGTTFPSSPSERDLFYRTDLHRWFIYFGSDWIDLTLAVKLGIIGVIELPLQCFYYRVGDHGLIYREGPDDADEYLVINAHENESGWYSVLSIGRVFRALESGFFIEWIGKYNSIEAYRTFWPGGLEKKHGRYTQGLICFERTNSNYKTVTTDDIGNTSKIPSGVDWTSDTKFKIVYKKVDTDWVAEFYCDDVKKTTHTGTAENVPTAMDSSFFLEVAHNPSGPPVTEGVLSYKWRSFKYGEL